MIPKVELFLDDDKNNENNSIKDSIKKIKD